MKIIAHRANINGPTKLTENTKDAIQQCLNNGYDVEIDVISGYDTMLVMGHDYASEMINLEDFSNSLDRFWFHAKNIPVLSHLLDLKEIYNYRYDIFFHDRDECVLTHNGKIWMYPTTLKRTGRHNICVLPEQVNIQNISESDFYGICTDYPQNYERLINT